VIFYIKAKSYYIEGLSDKIAGLSAILSKSTF